MQRFLLLVGAAALALSVPAAALADGYNRRPAYMQAKPKPKPVVHRAKAKPAPQRQARHVAPRLAPAHHNAARHAAVLSVQYEELETVETRVYEERDGYSHGPVVGYSERYISPSRGCYAQAPCGYSTGVHASGRGMSHGPHGASGHVQGSSYGTQSSHGHSHGGTIMHGHTSSYGGEGGHGHGGNVTVVRPGYDGAPFTGGVGYGVDGGPVFGATTVIVPGSRFTAGRRFTGSSGYAGSSAYSSAQAYGGSSYGRGFGYGGTYGQGGNGYLGFKPSSYGQGVGASGYTGFQR